MKINFLYPSGILLRQRNSRPKFLYASILICTLQCIQRYFNNREHFWKTYRFSVFITSYDSVWIFSVLSKSWYLTINFILGNRKKFIGPVSREVGVTGVFVAANNCRITSDTWVGALSWCRDQYLLSHFSGSLRWMFSLNLLRISQEIFSFAPCASGHSALNVK